MHTTRVARVACPRNLTALKPPLVLSPFFMCVAQVLNPEIVALVYLHMVFESADLQSS